MCSIKTKIMIIIMCLVAGNSFGASRIISETFEDQQWSDSFQCIEPGTCNITTDQAFGGSTYSARLNEFGIDGSFEFNFSDILTDGDEIYIKYYQYFPSSNWSWAGVSATGLKQFRTTTGARGFSDYPIIMYKSTAAGYCSNTSFGTHSGFIGSSVQSRRGNCTSPSFDTWHLFEYYLKYADNGVIVIKMDGVIIESYSVDNNGFENGAVGGIRFVGGNGWPSGGIYYIDDVEIWDGIPGNNSPPDPPTGLDVIE